MPECRIYERKSKKSKIDPFYNLLNTILDNKEVVIFLGSGASREGTQEGKKFPGSTELMDRVINKYGSASQMATERLEIFSDIMKKWEAEKQLSVQIYDFLNGEPGLAHYYLASLSISLFGESNALLYITANNDNLMIKAFKDLERNPVRRFETFTFSLVSNLTGSVIEEIAINIDGNLKRGRPVLIKLFGDLNYYNLKFRQETTEFQPGAEEKLIEWMKKPIIFIGYDFPDKIVKKLLFASRGISPVFIINPSEKLPSFLKELDSVCHIKTNFLDFTSELLKILELKRPAIKKKIDTILDFLNDTLIYSDFKTSVIKTQDEENKIERTTKVKMTIDLSINPSDKKILNMIRYSLAGMLEISVNSITILDVQPGSTEIILRIPQFSNNKLFNLYIRTNKLAIPLPGKSSANILRLKSDIEIYKSFSKFDEEIIKRHTNHIKNNWVVNGITFQNENYERFSLKRANITNCTFINCNFKRVASTGSSWYCTTFIDCNFEDANFQFSDFSNSSFKSQISNNNDLHNNPIIGAGFTGCNFSNATMEKMLICGSNYSNAIFTNAKIMECKIESCTLEGASFKYAYLKNIELRNINIEYCDFSYANLDNVTLALMQFPYVFGITSDHIKQNKVKISTNDKARFPDRILPWDELCAIIPSMINYYNSNQEYFPVSNLYFASKLEEKFREFLELGIRFNLANDKYRELKFFCKLANYSELYTDAQLRGLYNLIQKLHYSQKKNETLMHSFKLHEGEIREFLLNKIQYGKFALQMSFKVIDENILNEFDALSLILKSLSNFLIGMNTNVHWNEIKFSKNPLTYASINLMLKNADASKEEEIKSNFLLLINALFGINEDSYDLLTQFNHFSKQQISILRKMKIEMNEKIKFFELELFDENKIIFDLNKKDNFFPELNTNAKILQNPELSDNQFHS